MAVHQRGQGFQANVMVEGKRYRKTFSTSSDASSWENKIKFSVQNDIEILETSASRYWSYREASDQCFEIEWKGQKSEETNENNRRLVGDFFIHKFGTDQVNLNKITTLVLDEFVIYFREKGNSDSTINRKLMCLSKILKFAIDRKKMREMPHITLRKEPEGIIRWLSLDEEQLLLKYFDFSWTKDYLDYYIVAVDTGLRTGEMLRLRKKDIVNNQLIVWISKGGTARNIDLTPRAKKVLERRCRNIGDKANIFSITKEELRYRFTLMRKDIPELSDVHPHIMRHTFCSRLVQLGVPIPNVQKLMGHKMIATTMRYSHLAPNHAALDVSLLSKFVAGEKL